MARLPMSSQQKEKIKKMAKKKTFTETGKFFGLSRVTIARIVKDVKPKPRKRLEVRLDYLRKVESRQTAPGCFNVFDRIDWLTGGGAG